MYAVPVGYSPVTMLGNELAVKREEAIVLNVIPRLATDCGR